MLYGDINIQKDVLQHAQKYADALGVKLIFGAMVGSISKGIQYPDSDYDTRFLYLRKDFPDKICIPSEMEEKELVKRFYPEGKVFEWIPLWEATSFLQFLHYPSFKNDFSVGLYNIVGWTFQSPYLWDPYGIRNRIMPFVNQIFRTDYEIEYHKNIITKYKENLEADDIVTKYYLYAVHATATIEWCAEYRTQPPIDLRTLLCSLCHADIWYEAKKILEEARNMSRIRMSKKNVQINDTNLAITTKSNAVLNKYIRSVESQTILQGATFDDLKTKTLLKEMYDIIYESVYECNDILL